jgi:hypothetical protein
VNIKKAMASASHTEKLNWIQQELDGLEKKLVLLDGKLVKPGQCYHFSCTPPHILYKTNCPEELMEKIEAILSKYKNA